jgi:cell wall-associated NlpC family hydrolase
MRNRGFGFAGKVGDIIDIDADGNVIDIDNLPMLPDNSAKNLPAVIDVVDDLPDVINTKPSTSGIFGKFREHAKSSKLGGFIAKVVEAIKGFFKDSRITSFVSKAISSFKGSKIKTTADKFTKVIGEFIIDKLPPLLTKHGGKMGAKAAAKLSAYTASAATLLVADAVFSFVNGYRNANSILGITEQPNLLVRVLCGIIEALNSVFLLGLVPLDAIVNLVISATEAANIPVFEELKIQREAAKKEVEDYNKEHGTNFTSVEEYNKKDRLSSKIKGGLTKVGNWISNLFKKDDEGTEITNTEYDYEVNNEVTANGSGIKNKLSSRTKSLFGKGSSLFGRGSKEHDHIVEKPQDFISQVDPRYKYKKFNIPGDTRVQTLGDSGCAPAAAAMAINGTVGRSTESMENASRLALKYKVKDDGVSASYFDDEFSRHGLNANYIESSSKISNELMHNRNVVLMGQDRNNTSKANSPFGPNPHYVTATGMSMDGKYVYINDPEASRPNIKYSASKVLGHSKLGISAVARGSKIAAKFKKFVARGSYGPETTQYKVWNALRAAGYNEIATAAAMGNIQHESGFRADAIEKGSGVGFGLVQWSYGRRTAMENYAKQKGVNPSDLKVQIEYLLNELAPKSGIWTKASSKYGLGSLSRSDWADGNDLVKATKAFMCCFERPSYDPDKNHIDRRIEAANEFLQAFTGMSVDTSLSFDTTPVTDSATTTSSSNNPLSGLFSIINRFAGLYGLNDSSSAETTTGSYINPTTIYSGEASGNVSSNEANAEKQKALVNTMYSIQGKLKYAQNNAKYPGSRNPEDGSGDCSSTVQWAYKKILGVDPGGWTGDQRTNSNTYTVATSTKDESKLQLGDLLLKDGHVEMYAGNNTMIGHGGGKDGKKPGPTVKTLDKSGKYNLVRRWVGFQGSGSGLSDGAYGSALNYITARGSNSILPFEVEQNKPSTLEYNNTVANVKDSKPITTKTSTSMTTSVKSNTSGSNEMLNYVKSVEALLKDIVSNTDQLNNIFKLLGEFVTASVEASSNGTKENKEKAVFAKQNLIHAMQNSGSFSGEPDAELMRLIKSSEHIARQ